MNIMGRLVMRPPILLVRSCILFIYHFLRVPQFLMRGFLLPSRGSPGRSISRFSFSYGFYLLPAAFTSWAFSPFFPQDKMYPDGPPNGQTRGMGWMSGVLGCKSDTMKGADDGSANPLWWLTKTHEYQLAKPPHQSPQQWSSGLV
jgi:hypothetical protein